MEAQTKFYEEGKKAFYMGTPVTSNPYKMSVWNAYHLLWRRGWTEAHNVSLMPTRAPRMELSAVQLRQFRNPLGLGEVL